MLTLARWLWKSSWYCRARGVLLTVTELKLTVTHNTTIIWANGTVSVKIRLTCTTCHCWKSPNAFQRQTLLVYSAQKRRHNAVSKCKIYWCYEIRALPLGVSFPWSVGWWWLPWHFLSEGDGRATFNQSFPPPTPPIFVFCSHLNSSENRALQTKEKKKCSTICVRFYFVHSPTTHLKNFELFVSFEASTLRFIYTYKNIYVEVVVFESIWLLFFDRAVTRGSILSSFIESCGSNSSQP